MAKRRKKIGLPPGSVIFTGNRKVETAYIHYLQYDSDSFTDQSYDTKNDIIINESPDEKVDWYDIRGLHDTDLITALGKLFQIHPLIQEDVVDIYQRPKFEQYSSGNLFIIRAFHLDKNELKVRTEQVSLFFKTGLVISFQESDTDLFQPIRERIRTSAGRIRNKGADYLVYSLLDNTVDHYYYVLDSIGELIEKVEDDLLEDPDHTIKSRIHNLKKELLIVRKSILSLRESLSQFSKSDSQFIASDTILYIRDLYDHVVQLLDTVENYRDLLNGLQDLYLSEISFKMNKVMQILTIITTIFVPLSFLAGLY
ncbi:MAG: magnesium/cobalt transporter CorA, partial [Saprospiraceae bacterium]|nr:magnesium/cobalt transporter CorA [Saprospiraceae bacterium]